MKLLLLHPVKLLKTYRARHLALAECVEARREFQSSVNDLVLIHDAHPVPLLVGAAGVGFLLGLLGAGSKLMRSGARIASGPAWGLVRQVVDRIKD